jgi:sec-independent protein translocase protein TatB
MFNIGGGEVLVIALVALIVLGPQRLPEAARQVGKVMGDVRRLSSGFQSELKGAFSEADMNTSRSPRRDVLGSSAPGSNGTAGGVPAVSEAASAVSRQASGRRQPLRAAPEPKKPSPSKKPSPTKKASSTKKPSAAKSARPRPKGP